MGVVTCLSDSRDLPIILDTAIDAMDDLTSTENLISKSTGINPENIPSRFGYPIRNVSHHVHSLLLF